MGNAVCLLVSLFTFGIVNYNECMGTSRASSQTTTTESLIPSPTTPSPVTASPITVSPMDPPPPVAPDDQCAKMTFAIPSLDADIYLGCGQDLLGIPRIVTGACDTDIFICTSQETIEFCCDALDGDVMTVDFVSTSRLLVTVYSVNVQFAAALFPCEIVNDQTHSVACDVGGTNNDWGAFAYGF